MRLYLSNSEKYAIIDEEDKWLCQYSWHIYRGYVCRTGYLGIVNGKKKHTTLRLNREILQADYGEKVIFKDKDKLNCKRDNLMIGSQRNVTQFKKKVAASESKYKGVRASKGGFVASIKNDGHNIHLGTFKKEVDAAKCYDKKAIELFSEFAFTNF